MQITNEATQTAIHNRTSNPASSDTVQERRMPGNGGIEIAFVSKDCEALQGRVQFLEKENLELKQEVAHLKAQLGSLRAQDSERKSLLWKKMQSSINNRETDATAKLASIGSKMPDKSVEPGKFYKIQPEDIAEKTSGGPKPPPRLTPPASPPSHEKNKMDRKVVPSAPTPPPPPPSSRFPLGIKAVRRVPEVMEFYRSLTRKDSQLESKTTKSGVVAAKFSKNMIGEIENRSSYLLAIKSDVENRGEFINSLARAVAASSYSKISDVEEFVKWLDKELSILVDERAVLKHFPHWPERKADALREAAFSYRDLKNLEYEVLSYGDSSKQPLNPALKRMQALQDRLEQSVNNVERIRDGAIKRYREMQIPWEWMLETGIVGQLKHSSVQLAKEYIKRVTKELLSSESNEGNDILVQGVRFAYRVHQFAGGFDTDTINAFEELRKTGTDAHNQ